METKTLKMIEILIMDDDIFFSNLIAKAIENLKQKKEIQARFRLNVRQYFKPKDCLVKAKDSSNKTPFSIAFIDYYIGDGINGKHLVNLLLERNKNAKIVLMSNSERIIRKLRSIGLNNSRYIKILKNNYTPDICCTIVENYIYNL